MSTRIKKRAIQVRESRLPAKIREIVGNDQKLGAAMKAALPFAKKDSGWREKFNRVARDFVMNRRALGDALDALIPRRGGRPKKNLVTVTKLGIAADGD